MLSPADLIHTPIAFGPHQGTSLYTLVMEAKYRAYMKTLKRDRYNRDVRASPAVQEVIKRYF